MIDYLSTLYWSDVRYLISVPLCVFVGFAAGWYEHKKVCDKAKRKEDLRLAVTNTVYLEDAWEEG